MSKCWHEEIIPIYSDSTHIDSKGSILCLVCGNIWIDSEKHNEIKSKLERAIQSLEKIELTARLRKQHVAVVAKRALRELRDNNDKK